MQHSSPCPLGGRACHTIRHVHEKSIIHRSNINIDPSRSSTNYLDMTNDAHTCEGAALILGPTVVETQAAQQAAGEDC